MAKSEYLQREEAAKKQLGAKGVKKRVKQLPTAARASLREMTGIDVSRRGVKVDPGAAALAAAGFIPFGKSLSVAAKALKPAASRWSNAVARASKAANTKKIAPPDASKMLPPRRPMLPARPGTPPDASKMLPPRKPKPSTKALRDYRSTGRPPSKPGSMEGWQGIQNVRRGGR